MSRNDLSSPNARLYQRTVELSGRQEEHKGWCRALTPLRAPSRSHFAPGFAGDAPSLPNSGHPGQRSGAKRTRSSGWSVTSRQSQGHRVVRPRLRTPCHHPGERRVVTRPQSWRRASLPGASLKDRSRQRAPGRSEAPSSGPAGCSSPAETRAKPPLLSLLHVPSPRWLAAPRGLGYRWGAARVGRGFKAGSSQ